MLFYYILFKIVYFLNLRKASNLLQRMLFDKEEPTKIPDFKTPKEIENYINSKFQYRLDKQKFLGFSIMFDWVTDPEIFQTRLLTDTTEDGDCDDYHYWVATRLNPIVDEVYLLSTAYETGGHCTCVYKYQEKWYLFDYKIIEIKDPNDAPLLVSERHTKDEHEIKVNWYIFENLNFEAIAISPEKI